MAKSKLDFKKILLEKGERIGVGVAGMLAFLLIALSLFMPGKGLFSGSPDEKAKTLVDSATYINQRLADPNNKPTPADMPDPKSKDKLVDLEMKSIESSPYRLAALAPPDGGGSLGRRQPKVLDIEEATIKLARLQVQTFILSGNNPVKIKVLLQPEGGTASGAAGPGGPPSAAAAAAGRLRGMFKGKGGPGGYPGMPGMGGGFPGRPGSPLGVPGQVEGGESKVRKAIDISLTELEKRTDVSLAEQVRPVRMAILAASFPYKQQVEEFRKKLSLRSDADVLSERSNKPVNGRYPYSFRFLGVDVERRELDGDSQPITDWQVVDMNNTYRPYVIGSGRRFEPEDPELQSVIFPGLVMPRLMQFRPENVAKAEGTGAPGGPGSSDISPPPGPAGMRPPGMKGPGTRGLTMPGQPQDNEFASADPSKDQYPPVEKSLTKLQETLKSLRGKKTEVAAPPDRFRGVDDIFSANEPKEGDNETPGGIPGSRPPLSGPGGEAPDPNAIGEIPDYCLVRLIDVTIQPGKSYEYRMKLKMANPNYGRRDVANPAYAEKETLNTDWSKKTLKVQVDPELRYYAVDQKQLEPKYTGINFGLSVKEDQQVVLQAHRWMERVKLPGSEIEVGEWAIAERFAVWRGEYVGRSVRTQIPVWSYPREEFILAADNSSSSKRKPNVLVDFGYGTGRVLPEALAIDLHGSHYGFEKVTARDDEGKVTGTSKVSDECGTEVLILDPNGRLLFLEGALDAQDKAREERLVQVRKRIREVAEGSHKSNNAAPGGSPASPFGSN